MFGNVIPAYWEKAVFLLAMAINPFVLCIFAAPKTELCRPDMDRSGEERNLGFSRVAAKHLTKHDGLSKKLNSKG